MYKFVLEEKVLGRVMAKLVDVKAVGDTRKKVIITEGNKKIDIF